MRRKKRSPRLIRPFFVFQDFCLSTCTLLYLSKLLQLNVIVTLHFRSEAIEVFDEEEDDPSIDAPKCDNLMSRNGHVKSPTASIHDMTTSASEAIDADHKGKMISSFVSVIEGTKDLSLSEEKQRSPHERRRSSQPQTPFIEIAETDNLVHVDGSVPVPAKCSTQLRKLLHSHR